MKQENRILALLLVGVLALPMFAEETETAKSKWLDEYPKHVGLTWTVDEEVTANYVWRGLYVGGLSSQTDLSVGYGGLYLDMWWNLGATDWTFGAQKPAGKVARDYFNPEVDMTLGFSRWGLTVMFMHMYYFDKYIDGANSRYFDFDNHGYGGGGGITQEWRIKYKVSSKLPLTIMWCTRTWGRDGYYQNEAGDVIGEAGFAALSETEQKAYDLKRAYSSYLEIGYDWALPKNWTLTTQVGMTPWRSMYTGFQGEFAINNVNVRAMRCWDWGEHVAARGYLQCMVNPWNLATYGVTTNGLMLNAGFGISLK